MGESPNVELRRASVLKRARSHYHRIIRPAGLCPGYDIARRFRAQFDFGFDGIKGGMRSKYDARVQAERIVWQGWLGGQNVQASAIQLSIVERR